MSETAVSSFIIRFTQEQAAETSPTTWRGFIRHVQSAEQRHFTHIEEALTFMAARVDIGDGWLSQWKKEK